MRANLEYFHEINYFNKLKVNYRSKNLFNFQITSDQQLFYYIKTQLIKYCEEKTYETKKGGIQESV